MTFPGTRTIKSAGVLFLAGAVYEIVLVMYDSFWRTDGVLSLPDPLRRIRIDLAFSAAELVPHGDYSYPAAYGVVGVSVLVVLAGLAALVLGTCGVALARFVARMLRRGA